MNRLIDEMQANKMESLKAFENLEQEYEKLNKKYRNNENKYEKVEAELRSALQTQTEKYDKLIKVIS